MLTPEEEKARGIKISQLYGRPLPRELEKKKPARFRVRPILGAGLVLVAPFVLGAIILRTYQTLGTIDMTDLGALGILFIVASLLEFGIAVYSIRSLTKTLSEHYVGGRISFWGVMAGVIAVAYFVAKQTSILQDEHFSPLTVSFASFVGITILLDAFWSLLVVYICDRLARRG